MRKFSTGDDLRSSPLSEIDYDVNVVPDVGPMYVNIADFPCPP